VAEEKLVLRRVVNRDKSSRAFINDQPTTVQLIRAISHHLLDVHGQFDALSSPTDYRNAVDSFLQEHGLADKVSHAYMLWDAAAKAVEAHKTLRSQGLAQLPFWRQGIAELEALALKEGEVDALESQRSQMSHQGKVMDGLQEITQSLETKALPSLIESSRTLTRLAGLVASFTPLSERLESTYVELNDLAQTLIGQRNEMASGALSLEAIESRLFAIRSLSRKYHTSEVDLPALLEDYRLKVAALEDDQAHLDKLMKACLHAKEAYVQEAKALSHARKEAAKQIQSLVAVELPDLRLPEAQFIIQIKQLPEEKWGEHGTDEVLFMVQTNTGSVPGTIHTIASGGERSRLYLALKLALAKAYPEMSFVFDEVDSGIGGATASAVGERLKRLASHQGAQVMVVTHSPQVAACGNDHWHITKRTVDGLTTTQAHRLTTDERQEEIARMLAGNDVTPQARAAAMELMKVAG
jgi:DNA repair protein RecN (Recombination protein N)